MYSQCVRCATYSVVLDPVSGVVACESCGLVSETDNVRLETPDFDGTGLRVGTYVRGRGTATSTLGGIGRLGWQAAKKLGFRSDRKQKYTYEKLDQLTALLRLSKDKASDVRYLLKLVTEERWGAGHWTDILVGTCIYIIARQHHLPLSAAEIAIAVNCEVKVLMRMYFRVLDFIDLQIPGIDLRSHFDTTLSHHQAFSKLEKDVLRRMSKQGHVLLECGSNWFVSTGRHPMAVVAAVVILVATANHIENVDMEEISSDLHVSSQTSRYRLKEFKASLVGIGQGLPWGKDITMKTVDRHLPFLLNYLLVKMKAGAIKLSQNDTSIRPSLPLMAERKGISPSKEDTALRHLAKALCLKFGAQIKKTLMSQTYTVKEMETEDVCAEEGQSSKAELPPKRRKLEDDQSFAAGFLSRAEEGMELAGDGRTADSCSEAPGYPAGVESNGTHTVQDEQPTWDALPPSFVANRAACAKRLEKINAAKKRIDAVKQDMKDKIEHVSLVECNSELRSARPASPFSSLCMKLHMESKGLDLEDLLIEYLLLHGADEELIEAGYYSLLLSTPPVQPDHEDLTERELLKYFRSPSEIEFLLSLSQEEPLSPWLDERD